MEISMLVEFRILQKINGKYIPISNKEAKAVSIGGFGFEINGEEIPFDWDAFTGTESDNVCGYCHHHNKGATWNQVERKRCLQKQCNCFEMYPDHPVWKQRAAKKKKRKERKARINMYFVKGDKNYGTLY